MSGAFSLSTVTDGAVGITVGRFTDRFGPRKVLVVCGLLVGTGFLLMSRITESWHMYLVYGLLIGVGLDGRDGFSSDLNRRRVPRPEIYRHYLRRLWPGDNDRRVNKPGYYRVPL